MRRIFTTTIIFVLIVASTQASLALAEISGASASLETQQVTNQNQQIRPDHRVKKLQVYLESFHSPLAPYARVFVEKADQYEIPDWSLVPAIAGVESTFGKHIPYNSYNAYGWANGNFDFESWEDSIDIVTQTLKEKYYDKGANTVFKIARIYAPPSTTWASKVNYFMQQIQNFQTVSHEDLEFSL